MYTTLDARLRSLWSGPELDREEYKCQEGGRVGNPSTLSHLVQHIYILLIPSRKIEICDKPCQLDERTENYKQQEKTTEIWRKEQKSFKKHEFAVFHSFNCINTLIATKVFFFFSLYALIAILFKIIVQKLITVFMVLI